MSSEVSRVLFKLIATFALAVITLLFNLKIAEHFKFGALRTGDPRGRRGHFGFCKQKGSFLVSKLLRVRSQDDQHLI